MVPWPVVSLSETHRCDSDEQGSPLVKVYFSSRWNRNMDLGSQWWWWWGVSVFKFYFCFPHIHTIFCSCGQNSQVPGLTSQQATQPVCHFSQEEIRLGDESGSRPCSQ